MDMSNCNLYSSIIPKLNSANKNVSLSERLHRRVTWECLIYIRNLSCNNINVIKLSLRQRVAQETPSNDQRMTARKYVFRSIFR